MISRILLPPSVVFIGDLVCCRVVSVLFDVYMCGRTGQRRPSLVTRSVHPCTTRKGDIGYFIVIVFVCTRDLLLSLCANTVSTLSRYCCRHNEGKLKLARALIPYRHRNSQFSYFHFNIYVNISHILSDSITHYCCLWISSYSLFRFRWLSNIVKIAHDRALLLILTCSMYVRRMNTPRMGRYEKVVL